MTSCNPLDNFAPWPRYGAQVDLPLSTQCYTTLANGNFLGTSELVSLNIKSLPKTSIALFPKPEISMQSFALTATVRVAFCLKVNTLTARTHWGTYQPWLAAWIFHLSTPWVGQSVHPHGVDRLSSPWGGQFRVHPMGLQKRNTCGHLHGWDNCDYLSVIIRLFTHVRQVLWVQLHGIKTLRAVNNEYYAFTILVLEDLQRLPLFISDLFVNMHIVLLCEKLKMWRAMTSFETPRGRENLLYTRRLQKSVGVVKQCKKNGENLLFVALVKCGITPQPAEKFVHFTNN